MDAIGNVSILNISEKLKLIEEISFNLAKSGYLMETLPDPDTIIIRSRFFRLVLPNYKPQGVQEVFEGLMSLGIYWKLWPKSRSFLPINAINPEWPKEQERGEAMLEIALAKLAYQTAIFVQSAVSEDQKKIEKAAKIMQLNSSRKEAANKRMANVLDAFYHVGKSPGDSLGKIIKKIIRRLKNESGDCPSKITIRRYITRDERLMNDCFEKQGKRYFIKSIVW